MLRLRRFKATRCINGLDSNWFEVNRENRLVLPSDAQYHFKYTAVRPWGSCILRGLSNPHVTCLLQKSVHEFGSHSKVRFHIALVLRSRCTFRPARFAPIHTSLQPAGEAVDTLLKDATSHKHGFSQARRHPCQDAKHGPGSYMPNA